MLCNSFGIKYEHWNPSIVSQKTYIFMLNSNYGNEIWISKCFENISEFDYTSALAIYWRRFEKCSSLSTD